MCAPMLHRRGGLQSRNGDATLDAFRSRARSRSRHRGGERRESEVGDGDMCEGRIGKKRRRVVPAAVTTIVETIALCIVRLTVFRAALAKSGGGEEVQETRIGDSSRRERAWILVEDGGRVRG